MYVGYERRRQAGGQVIHPLHLVSCETCRSVKDEHLHVLIDGLLDVVRIVPELGVGVIAGANSVGVARLNRADETFGKVEILLRGHRGSF